MERLEGRGGETWRTCLQRMAGKPRGFEEAADGKVGENRLNQYLFGDSSPPYSMEVTV